MTWAVTAAAPGVTGEMCFWLSAGEGEELCLFLIFWPVKGAARPIPGGCLGHFNKPSVQWVGSCVFDLMERVDEILLYPILCFILAYLTSSAAHSTCLSQAVGGQVGTTIPTLLPFVPSCTPLYEPQRGRITVQATQPRLGTRSEQFFLFKQSRNSNFCKAAKGSGEWEWQMKTLPSVAHGGCVGCSGVSLPQAEQQQQQGRQHSLWAQLLPVPADLWGRREKSGASACPGSLPAPAKGRGSTDAAGGGHLLWKGTEILCSIH